MSGGDGRAELIGARDDGRRRPGPGQHARDGGGARAQGEIEDLGERMALGDGGGEARGLVGVARRVEQDEAQALELGQLERQDAVVAHQRDRFVGGPLGERAVARERVEAERTRRRGGE